MYKKILCIITAFVLCTNVALAKPKDSVQDIETISNSLNTVFLAVLQGKEVENLKKEINFVQSELNRARSDVLRDMKKFEGKDKSIYFSLLSILNYYQIAIFELQDYHQGNSHQSLISAISSLNHGDVMLDVIISKI